MYVTITKEKKTIM